MKSNLNFFAAVGGVAALFLILSTASTVRAQNANSSTATNSVAAAAGKPVPYPFNYCLVSGDKLGGDMGDPVVFVYTNNGYNQEIKFCCDMCKPKFLKNPDKYMKIILAAEKKQAAH